MLLLYCDVFGFSKRGESLLGIGAGKGKACGDNVVSGALLDNGDERDGAGGNMRLTELGIHQLVNRAAALKGIQAILLKDMEGTVSRSQYAGTSRILRWW